ncbi:hypothetical protein NUU61_002656 [Penicillium alfredii]|uniref:Uncharacterized protein n=1 Tax=Penicillium alfredii TaxID=1506179 RepID=A0A9W9FRY8_9EURO|nr:uncharacterized protein NUU61_002656 [Penicillium alfredii]KAJ5105309.1 hypothetical protein NUU61_002656 [Penicillium alfredii]
MILKKSGHHPTKETRIFSSRNNQRNPITIETHQRALQSTWSGIETKPSVIKFTKDTPRVVHQALSLAQCHFKSLQIEKASTVYQNAFKSVFSSVSAKDELVMTATQELVSFYETTYQFTKGDRATKYHQVEEAETAYYQIFMALSKKETLESRARWKKAQQVYEVLWKTFVQHGQDGSVDSQEIEAIYSQYSALLEHKAKADISVIHDRAASYHEVCVRVYGASHVTTYKATMRLAEIRYLSEKYKEESLSLYEAVLKMNEKFSSSVLTREVVKSSTTTTTSTTSVIKQHLAKLYSSNSKTVTKYLSCYQEDYQSLVKQEGIASQTTLSALQELVHSYHKQNTASSTTEAVQTLQSATVSVFEKETNSQHLHKAAQSLAHLYTTLGQSDIAWTLMQSLRIRLIRETPGSQKESALSRKVTVFIVAFEENLYQKRTYTSIMTELVSEINLYVSFYGAKEKRGFFAIFVSGVRLLNFQRTRNATEEICLAEISKRDYGVHIIGKTVRTVHQEVEQGHFAEAYELASILHRFIQHVDGFRTHINTREGIQLAKYLLGHGIKKSPDAKLAKAMSELLRAVLQDILYVYRVTGVRFTDLDVNDVSEVTLLLGEQKNFEDLELVLTDLWSSRIVQKTWSSDTIIWIRRRLVEVRFSCGRKEQAIRLCSDLCYNIGRVWGSFDRIALELTALLSELYTVTGNYTSAMAVHEKALRQLAHAHDGISSAEMGSIAVQHTELLKRAFQRNGGRAKAPHVY